MDKIQINFDKDSDLSNFRIMNPTNEYAKTIITNGSLKCYTTKIDQASYPYLYASDHDLDGIQSINFAAKWEGLTNAGAFPSFELIFESGEWIRVFFYNNFSWGGYSEHVYQRLYANRGKAMMYFSDTTEKVMWNNVNYTSFADMTISHDIKTKTINVKVGSNTYSKDFSFGDEKIKSIKFGLNNHWFNDNKAGYMDYLTFNDYEKDPMFPNMAVKVNNELKKCLKAWVKVNDQLKIIDSFDCLVNNRINDIDHMVIYKDGVLNESYIQGFNITSSSGYSVIYTQESSNLLFSGTGNPGKDVTIKFNNPVIQKGYKKAILEYELKGNYWTMSVDFGGERIKSHSPQTIGGNHTIARNTVEVDLSNVPNGTDISAICKYHSTNGGKIDYKIYRIEYI